VGGKLTFLLWREKRKNKRDKNSCSSNDTSGIAPENVPRTDKRHFIIYYSYFYLSFSFFLMLSLMKRKYISHIQYE